MSEAVVIDGVEYNIAVDSTMGNDMTARVYFRMVDDKCYIEKIEYEEPVRGRGV